MKKIIFFLFLISNMAFADSYQSCKQLEKSEKKYLPEIIDRILTIQSFTCSKKGNHVIGTYTHLVDSSLYTLENINYGYLKTLNVVCKSGRKYLKQFDIEYSYFSKEGDFIGRNIYTYSDCK